MDNVMVPVLPLRKHDRMVDGRYMCNGRVVIWNGKKLKCEHLKNVAECYDCGGTQICEHKRMKNVCKECNGKGICEHGNRRTYCKECGGGGLCEHKRKPGLCTDCNSDDKCEHNHWRINCAACGNVKRCEHGKRKYLCVECGGSSLCEHNRKRSGCVDCGGSEICEHKKFKITCKLCHGSAICDHGKIKYKCVECGGSQTCLHKKVTRRCKICSPYIYLANNIRIRVYSALKNYTEKKKKHTIEYLGCSIENLRIHLEKQFTVGMSWENQGKWHIDHIRPCCSFDLATEEEKNKCFHYTNLQPMWGDENMAKNGSYNEATFPRKWVVDHWEPK